MNSHLQTDYSAQQPPKNDANGARPILRGNQQPAPSLTQPFVLNSWKEIAGYLGRGVRTVQRWEHEAGLPVHRPKGANRSAVLALRHELDHWLNGTPMKSDGNGNGFAGGVAPAASTLLQLARDLLAEGERLMQLDQKQRTEAEKLVQSVRETVVGLALASGGTVAVERSRAHARCA